VVFAELVVPVVVLLLSARVEVDHLLGADQPQHLGLGDHLLDVDAGVGPVAELELLLGGVRHHLLLLSLHPSPVLAVFLLVHHSRARLLMLTLRVEHHPRLRVVYFLDLTFGFILAFVVAQLASSLSAAHVIQEPNREEYCALPDTSE